eukprot:358705-Chlamydomonas_euryale.AAC.1
MLIGNAWGNSQDRLGHEAVLLVRQLEVLLPVPIAHNAVGRHQDALLLLDNEACVALHACDRM